jgi:hypothetical protein
VLEQAASFALEMISPGPVNALDDVFVAVKQIVKRINDYLDAKYTPPTSGPWSGV